jgi:predicted RNase H-like HicB family nuclease
MTCIIEKSQAGYCAYVEGVAGCKRYAATLDEVVRLVREALCRYFEHHLDAIPLAFKSHDERLTVEGSLPVAVSANALGPASCWPKHSCTPKVPST